MSHTMSKKKSEPDRHLPYRAVRIPIDLYHKIKKIADDNDRPTSREVIRALKEYAERHAKLPPRETFPDRDES